MNEVDTRSGSLPGITVVALVFIEEEGKLLLVRQSYGRGYWSLPGGVLERGESIDQAAIREVKEETGLEVRLMRVVGLYSKAGEGSLAISFVGEREGGILEPGGEISECRFFPYGQFPQNIRDHFWQRLEDYRQHCTEVVWRTQ